MRKLILLPLTIISVIGTHVACSNTDFGGKAEKKGATNVENPSSDAIKSTGGGFPEAPNIQSPGWIGDKARNDFVDLFNASKQNGKDGNDTDSKSQGGSGTSGDDSDASADSPGQKLVSDVDGVLWIPCDLKSEGGGGVFPSKFYGKSDHSVRMSGEWCPKVEGESKATVLFVIDRSGSMTGSNEGPNDPTKNGSCGRLKAAQKIMEKLNNAQNTKVRAGVVTFSNSASTRVPLGSLQNVEESIVPEVFCGSDPGQYVLTNYEAAFKTATNQLKGEKGSKIVIFISDGSPTLYDGLSAVRTISGDLRQQSEAKGLEAAESLRQIDGVSLFALFLGYKASGAGTASDPKGYLEKVAGGPDQVRLTKDAEELVEAAGNLALPLDQIQITESKGILTNLKGQKDIAIEKVERHPTEPGRFIWYTEPFSFAGNLNEGVLNTLTVTAKSSTGVNLKTTSPVTFFLQN